MTLVRNNAIPSASASCRSQLSADPHLQFGVNPLMRGPFVLDTRPVRERAAKTRLLSANRTVNRNSLDDSSVTNFCWRQRS
jgi:hypothetical protein